MTDMDGGTLGGALAQRVVDTIGPRIEHPLNIMDAHGLIVASTIPGRVGALHAGARKALEEHRVVLEHEPDRKGGIMPGVNVPLYLSGSIRGVVGVTGDPNKVAPLAQLISLTVQLLLSQEQEHACTTLKNSMSSETLAGIISGSSPKELVLRQLNHLGVPGPWRLGMCHPGEAPPRPTSIVPELRSGIENRRTLRINLHGMLWTLESFGTNGNESCQTESDDRVVFSEVSNEVEQLVTDAEVFRTLSRYPSLIPRLSMADVWNIELAVAAARSPQPTMGMAARRSSMLSEEQCRTLLVVASAHTHTRAAERLFVHRNTLVQRLDRIREMSGLDARSMPELLSLLNSMYARVRVGNLHIF